MSWPIPPIGPREPRLEPVEAAHHAERVHRERERPQDERERRRDGDEAPADSHEPGEDGHVDVLA